MRHWFTAFTFCFGLLLMAHGRSTEIPITTTNLDHSRYIFAVLANAAPNGVAFRVTITAKGENIPTNSPVDLSIVTHKKDGNGWLHSIESVKSQVLIVLKKDRRVWEANFTVPHSLRKPGLCFVFTEFAGDHPSVDFYEIQLLDFVR